MSLVRYKSRFPFWENWMENDFFTDRMLNAPTNIPAMNVKEQEANFEIELALPGFSKEDIEVSLEDESLLVKASKEDEHTEEKTGYTRKEFSYNNFERRVPLLPGMNTKKEVKAAYRDGILKLVLEKEEASNTRLKKQINIT